MLGHGLDGMKVRCVEQCRELTTPDAVRNAPDFLIFHLGTFSTHGINVDFTF